MQLPIAMNLKSPLACHVLVAGLLLAGSGAAAEQSRATLDATRISEASGAEAMTVPDGVVRISWSRSDVPVSIDGSRIAPAAGLGTWAAFAPMGDQAMVMGDTVVFEDEVDAAMDAAFAHGLSVTGLHNHFFYDTPKVYFMHIGGVGAPAELARSVKLMWDAIKQVREAKPTPTAGFGGSPPVAGKLDVGAIERIIGHPAPVTSGVAKVTIGREGHMHGVPVGASMGLTTWAAFSGSDGAAVIDGDFIMTADEVQPVLRALRDAGLHVVALHNHMIGETPPYFFTHFWGAGRAEDLARSFKHALDRSPPLPRDAEGTSTARP
jgi:hypothetical protein